MNRETQVYNRQKAVAAYHLTRCVTRAAKRIGVATSYVKTWVQRFLSTGHVNDSARSGRSSTISAAAVRRAQALMLTTQSIRLTANKLKELGLIPPSMSFTTVWRHLGDGKTAVKHRSVRKQPLINPKTAGQRVAFAKLHTSTNWDRVFFLDSKYFYVCNKTSRKQWVLADTIPTAAVVKHSPAIHVYAGFSARGTSALIEATGTTGFRFLGVPKGTRGVNAVEYQHVLKQHLISAARQQFGRGKWQLLHDGAPPHKAASTKALLAEEKVQQVQGWPGNSPDLNPIENLWAWVSYRLRERNITTLAGLRKELKAAWRAIPTTLLKSLARSMPKRLRLVKASEGQYIGY